MKKSVQTPPKEPREEELKRLRKENSKLKSKLNLKRRLTKPKFQT